MWKWLFLLVLPVLILIGGAAWYFWTEGYRGSQREAVKVENPSTVPEEKKETATLAPNQKPRPQPGPGWAVNCRSGAQDQALNCNLSQTVVMKGSGRLLTRVTVFLSAKDQEPKLSVQLPLGVLVPAGASIRVDDNAPLNLRLRTCIRDGCFAESALSSDLLAQLQKGSTLTVAFQNLAQKTVSLPLALGEFAEAYRKAQSG